MQKAPDLSQQPSRSARTARIEILYFPPFHGKIEESRSARTARIEIVLRCFQTKLPGVAVRKDRED